MKFLVHSRLRVFAVVVVAAVLCLDGAAVATSASTTFAGLMDAAMAAMDKGMAAPTTGDPDRDFAQMMIPHHQGAIDMAVAELRFGHDDKLRRLAQGIIVEQGQEIVVMHDAMADLPPAPAARAPASPDPMPDMSMCGMPGCSHKGR